MDVFNESNIVDLLEIDILKQNFMVTGTVYVKNYKWSRGLVGLYNGHIDLSMVG